jgi:hypothetical protein
MLYIAVLIAALVWVGVIVARHQSGPIPDAYYQDDDFYDYYGYANGPYGYGLYFQGFRLNHGPFDDD